MGGGEGVVVAGGGESRCEPSELVREGSRVAGDEVAEVVEGFHGRRGLGRRRPVVGTPRDRGLKREVGGGRGGR